MSLLDISSLSRTGISPTVGEEGEDEEDEEEWLSCFMGVREVDEDAVEELDKPGTIESLRVDFRCVHRFQLPKVCNQYVALPNSPRVQSVSKEQSR